MNTPNFTFYIQLKQFIIINGPNLNLLGKRETNIYGKRDFDSFFEKLVSQYPAINLQYFQSNHEGAILDKLHEVGFSFDGIILNGGALTHTSVALADAIAAISSPVIEVHISNIHAREPFRHTSLSGAHCKGIITGLGLAGYELALQYFLI